MNTYTVYCCTVKHAASTERDRNKYVHLQQSVCLPFTVMAHTTKIDHN